MKQKLVIMINGPIGSGKDTLGPIMRDILKGLGYRTEMAMFKDELYKYASLISSIPLEMFIKQATDRTTKELPWFMLPKNFVEGTPSYGTYFSPRDWLIHVSERVLKPMLGEHVFGKSTWDNVVLPTLIYADKDVVIITDCGFDVEVDYIRNTISQKETDGELDIQEILPIVIRLQREGTSFEGDSRYWISQYDFIVDNDGTIEDLRKEAVKVIYDLVGDYE